MAVKVRTAFYTEKPVWGTRKDGSHVLQRDFNLMATVDYRGTLAEMVFHFKEGFRCDGLSVPWALKWFLPSWDDSKPIYNLSGAVHDWLYTTGGNYGALTREECDDMLRGLIRESGYGRFKAGCADKAVEWFAGGRSHWKNDSYNIADKCVLTMRIV